jgi:hypothetical protein
VIVEMVPILTPPAAKLVIVEMVKENCSHAARKRSERTVTIQSLRVPKVSFLSFGIDFCDTSIIQFPSQCQFVYCSSKDFLSVRRVGQKVFGRSDVYPHSTMMHPKNQEMVGRIEVFKGFQDKKV